VYREQTAPLEAFYAERELLRVVDAEAPFDVVSDRMFEALEDVL
jgi:adenylate kinase family enzyme